MRILATTLLLLAACKGTEANPSRNMSHGHRHSSADGLEETPAPLQRELRTELLAMLDAGEEVREADHNKVVVVGESGGHDHSSQEPVHGPEMPRIDATNTSRLKEIIATHGWPGRSLVGRDGALAAFLVAQHADADPEFQRSCLALMRGAPSEEVSPGNIAYLTDRVRTNAGMPQLYGTQFWIQDGALVPRPIEEPDGLDARRAEAGLIPMEEYLEHMQQHEVHPSHR